MEPGARIARGAIRLPLESGCTGPPPDFSRRVPLFLVLGGELDSLDSAREAQGDRGNQTIDDAAAEAGRDPRRSRDCST